MSRRKIPEQNSLIPIDNSINELFDFEEKREKKYQIGYIPSFFTATSLPFKNMHKTNFVRKGSNGIVLTLSSPKNVPFGRYGRLLLSVLTTHAVLAPTKKNGLFIEYASLADLLRELQLPKQRGTQIKEQLECFSSAAFTFEQEVKEVQSAYLFKDLYEDGNYPKKDIIVKTKSTGNIRFTTGIQYKEIEDGSGEVKSGYFKIILSPEFCDFCSQHAVPINYEVYKDIESPIGKDLYAWLVFRNNALQDKVFIPREKLVEQFIPVEPGKDKNIVNVNYARIIELLKEIKEKYYKEVKIDFSKDGDGITLHKSPTPVLKDDKRYALITTDL